jgi:hypothetical protein
LMDQQGNFARLCHSLVGAVPDGSACRAGDQVSCRAGFCDDSTQACQALCCTSADCPGGLRCNLSAMDQNANYIYKFCGAAGQGQGALGAACGGDAQCRSDSCIAGRCSDVCCVDADCTAGTRCRLHEVDGPGGRRFQVSMCK